MEGPKLSIDEQIIDMRGKGITFEKVSIAFVSVTSSFINA